MTLHFTHQGESVLLQGTTDCASLQVIGVELLDDITRIEDPWMAHLNNIHSNPVEGQILTPIKKLLRRNIDLFKDPSELPPRRNHDHRIILKLEAQPVNLRPYRYPYHPKAELEKQVKEMLDLGIIRPSQSSYASPTLLVGKKDGTFKMCIDYRRLNSMTVKDKLPIPIIDDLLHELNGVAIFTTLNLRSGYYQIRLNKAYIEKNGV